MNSFIVFFLCFALSAFSVDSEAESMLRVRGKYGDVVYSIRDGDEWKNVAIHREKGVRIDLFQGDKNKAVRFDGGGESDLSKSGLYFVLNKIEHGYISGDGEVRQDVERAYCDFIDIKTGCILREETGAFCGGYWGDADDRWNLGGGDSIKIDRRFFIKMSRSELRSYFTGFSDVDNLNRCLPLGRH